MARTAVASAFPATVLAFVLMTLSGCFFVPGAHDYQGPPERPVAQLESYYNRGKSYTGYVEHTLAREDGITIKTIVINTDLGKTTITYYQRDEESQNLVFVFPVLGGKNLFENYFAYYFARHGFDTAIVHRSGEFKDPSRVHELEEIFRQNAVRDRIAIDFFEKEYKKTKFGSFGISRGAINVAVTAGIDERLKYNVLVMGGTDLVSLFRDSKEKGVKKYRSLVRAQRNITDDQFDELLRSTLKTDPKYLAGYIDARNTLMFLALFDRAVPIKYGRRLRRQIGNPDTIYLAATHYTGLLYTQFARIAPPVSAGSSFAIFPIDYVETESLTFYNRSFETGRTSFEQLLFRTLRLPLEAIGIAADYLF